MTILGALHPPSPPSPSCSSKRYPPPPPGPQPLKNQRKGGAEDEGVAPVAPHITEKLEEYVVKMKQYRCGGTSSTVGVAVHVAQVWWQYGLYMWGGSTWQGDSTGGAAVQRYGRFGSWMVVAVWVGIPKGRSSGLLCDSACCVPCTCCVNKTNTHGVPEQRINVDADGVCTRRNKFGQAAVKQLLAETKAASTPFYKLLMDYLQKQGLADAVGWALASEMFVWAPQGF